jgi:hypothetical protein
MWISYNKKVWLSSVTEGHAQVRPSEFHFFETLDTALYGQGAQRANALAQKVVDRARRVIDAIHEWREEHGLKDTLTTGQSTSDPAVHMKANTAVVC